MRGLGFMFRFSPNNSLQESTPIYINAHTEVEFTITNDKLMPLASTLRSRWLEEYKEYEGQLCNNSREVLITAAMLDPRFKSLAWLSGFATQDEKRKAGVCRGVNKGLLEGKRRVFRL